MKLSILDHFYGLKVDVRKLQNVWKNAIFFNIFARCALLSRNRKIIPILASAQVYWLPKKVGLVKICERGCHFCTFLLKRRIFWPFPEHASVPGLSWVFLCPTSSFMIL